MAIDWGSAATAVGGSALGLLGNIGAGKRAKKAIAAQEAAQQRLNEQNAQLNYNYGEMAADAAHQRSLGLLQAETEANSLENQVTDAKNAGLSVGLLYGGGGGGGSASAGGGAQGGGAGNQRGQAADYLEVQAQKIANKQAMADLTRAANESSLLKAEKEKIKAETENIKEETSTSQELTPLQKELTRQQGIEKWIENIRKEWEHQASDDSLGESSEQNDVLNIVAHIRKKGYFGEKVAQELAEALSRTEGNKALTELNTEKKKGYWQELLNATRMADNDEIRAKAIKLASEWSTGEYTNWKTWADIATDAIGAITKLVGLGK